MLLCIPCKTIDDYGLDDICSSFQKEGLKFSLIVVFDYDGFSKFDYNCEVNLIKSKKSLEGSTNLIETLLFFSSHSSSFLLLDDELNMTEGFSKNNCKLFNVMFENKSTFDIHQINRLMYNLELFDDSNMEKLAFKTEVKKICDIFNFVSKLPISYELPKAGFLDKYVSSSLIEKYYDDHYFSKIHEGIDHFLEKNRLPIGSSNLLKGVSNFYKVNRSNIITNIEKGLSGEHLVPELVWLSVHFSYMAKLSYTIKDFPVSFANILRCLEYYLDFIFLYLGKYYTKGDGRYKKLFIHNSGEPDRGDKYKDDKEANGLGRKFTYFLKIEEFTFKNNLTKPIEKLIKLRNSSFFGHGLLIPDEYYAQMASQSVIAFIEDVEKQARYKGANWAKSRQSLISLVNCPIAAIELNSFISLIPYATTGKS